MSFACRDDPDGCDHRHRRARIRRLAGDVRSRMSPRCRRTRRRPRPAARADRCRPRQRRDRPWRLRQAPAAAPSATPAIAMQTPAAPSGSGLGTWEVDEAKTSRSAPSSGSVAPSPAGTPCRSTRPKKASPAARRHRAESATPTCARRFPSPLCRSRSRTKRRTAPNRVDRRGPRRQLLRRRIVQRQLLARRYEAGRLHRAPPLMAVPPRPR